MYPIKFENLYYDKVWGGRDFESFRDDLPEGNIGETWDIAWHPNGTGVVANGRFKGMTSNELIENYDEDIFGKTIKNGEFPLLVKLINSNENLSVQVHPNDDYARRVENSYGNTEAWYVVDAKDGAELIVGTNGCTKEQFEEAIKNDDIEKYEEFEGYKFINLCKSNYFKIDKCIIDSKYNTSTKGDIFTIITCGEGNGVITYRNGKETISMGDSLLIPATLGEYEITGKLEVLISYQ